MTRRELLSSVLLYSASKTVQSAQVTGHKQGFPGTKFQPYSRCLPGYLSSLARDAVEKRNAALAKLTSTDEIQARQKWVHKTLWELIGGTVERSPLNARVTGAFERGEYRV